MDQILIEGFIVEGIHGATYKEKLEPQRFQCDAILHKLAHINNHVDDLESTIDYRKVKDIITQTIKYERFNLIETLTETIAQRILELPSVEIIEITLRKLDIWGNGKPGNRITRHKHPAHLDLLDIHIEQIIQDLSIYGATATPILPEKRRLDLLREARSFTYTPKPEFVGKKNVREQLSACTEFEENSLFISLKNDFSQLLWRKLNQISPQPIFSRPFFTDMSIQKYDAGSLGISPHIDGVSRTNLICVFVLDGQADFSICTDRSGSQSKRIPADPGNVILLAGPGFLGAHYQPFHYVTNIPKERFVFRLIQK